MTYRIKETVVKSAFGIVWGKRKFSRVLQLGLSVMFARIMILG